MASATTAPIGYIVSRFPKVTETFIANEMDSVSARKLGIQLFAMVRTDEPTVHQSTTTWVSEMTVASRNPVVLAFAQLRWLARRPKRLIGLWVTTIGAHARTPRLLPRAVYSTAVGVHWAARLAEVRHVHAHWATYPAHIAWVAHRLTGQTYSITAHAHDIQISNPMLGHKLIEAAAVVTISEHNRTLLIDKVGAELSPRLVVIRCGVDAARFVPRQRPVNVEPPTFVCVASFMGYKGHQILLDAFAALRSLGVAARLRLIGDGELRGEIEAQIGRLGIGADVELLGWCSSEEVAVAVQAATAFVLASIIEVDGQTEGIPVALMEAMALGVPVIATRVSGVPELVIDRDTGSLVEFGDSTCLAAAMKSVIDNPLDADRRALRAIEHVRRYYDHDRNIAELVEMFERQLATNSPMR